MAEKFGKAELRRCARKALENLGYSVEDIGGVGAAPGVRLRVSKASDSYMVGVRTSLERKVGLLRDSKGSWMTVPLVDWVVVVTPSVEDPNLAEVLCFLSSDIIGAFDKALAASKKRNSEFSEKAPIFLHLDPSGPGKLVRGLKELQKWKHEVPLAAVTSRLAETGPEVRAFAARVKRKFAELIQVPEEDVIVEFRFKL